MRPLPFLVVLAACGSTSKDPDDGPGGSTTLPSTATGTVAGCAAIASVEVSSGELLLDGILTVELDQSSPVWAVCRNDADPEDALLIESEDAIIHTLNVLGTAAGATYTCTVSPTCAGATSASVTITTPQVQNHDGWTITRGPGEMSGTWTLFNDGNSCSLNPLHRLFIVDPDGQVRWSYPIGTGYVIDLDSSYIGDGVVHVGGGWGLFDRNAPTRGIERQVDLSGNVLHERALPDFGLGFNHHSEVLASGEHLNLTTSEETDGTRDWDGIAIEVWDPQTQSVTWSWQSQGVYDSGQLPIPTQASPLHANSVTFHDDALGPAAWISLYAAKAIWRVDRNTGALTHRFGADGDFTLVDPSGVELPPAEFAYVQHDPDYTEDGRVLLYDNGDGRPGGSYSRVAEYQLDLVTNTATLLWSWTEPNWYNPVVGDADYLDNGNVLVANGYHWCFSFNGDRSGVIEVDPTTDDVVWRLEYNAAEGSLFRAERYGGCEIFDNAKYCPAVADRIAELEAL